MQMVVGCQDYDFRELEQVTEERENVQYFVPSKRKRIGRYAQVKYSA